MRSSWWYPVREFARHTLVYAASFAFLVLSAVYGSAVTVLVSRFVESKFVLHVLIFLEYAAVVVDAGMVLLGLVEHLRRRFKRMMR